MSNTQTYTQFSIFIDKLLPEDDTATIQNNNTPLDLISTNKNDLGKYFDLTKATLAHSLLDLSAVSEISLTINSNLDLQSKLIGTSINVDLREFILTLEGRPVTVTMVSPDSVEERTVFKGFISEAPEEISVTSGTQFPLKCKTLLSQLETLSSNRNWDETIRAYGNIFTTLSGNRVNLQRLLSTLLEGTLLEGSEFIIIDGNLAPMPKEVWACINPTRMRLEVLREILIAYNRIVYQRPDGALVIQPLFYDDRVPDIYNIDVDDNIGNYLYITGKKNASNLPNRVDVIFGINFPGAAAGDTSIDNPLSSIFCSAPYTTKDSSAIVPIPNDTGVSYTDIYKSSVRLYNSGKWTQPIQKIIEIGNITNDTILANLLIYDYKYSTVWSKPANKYDNFARLYAQLFLAEVNTQNYNATVVYDFNQVIDEDIPLCKIVNIYNYTAIDYSEMLISSTMLNISPRGGSTLIVTTAPLMSITAAWGTIK